MTETLPENDRSNQPKYQQLYVYCVVVLFGISIRPPVTKAAVNPDSVLIERYVCVAFFVMPSTFTYPEKAITITAWMMHVLEML